jgi:hypothetical protein
LLSAGLVGNCQIFNLWNHCTALFYHTPTTLFMPVASPKVVHALADKLLENTQESPQHEAPILAAPLGEETNSNVEFKSEPGQTAPRVATPVDGGPSMPRTSSEEAQHLVPSETQKITRSMDASSKTTSPDAPTLLVHKSEATQIPTALLKEYARNASESDQREHNFYAKQLDSQLIFVRALRPLVNAISDLFTQAGIFSAVVVQLIPQTYPMLQVPNPHAFAIAINAGFFGSLVLSLCTAIMALQCRTWLDGYQVRWSYRGYDNMLKRHRHIA